MPVIDIPQAVDRPAKRGRAKPRCEHCGAPVSAGETFCCGGCAFVSRLIRDEGLDDYYKIKDAVTSPADGALAAAGDFGWLADAARTAEEATGEGRAVELELAVQGVSCAACVWLIERLHQRQPGSGDIEVSAEAGRMRLRWKRGGFDAPAFARELQRFGYTAGPLGATEHEAGGEPESRALARKTGLAAALAMNAMLFALPAYFGMSHDFEYARLFDTLAMGFATLSVAGCGGYFLSRAVRALRERVPHLDLPIALGITGAYVGSVYGWATANPECQYFDFVTGFIFLMLLGRWAQVVAVERNRRRLLREQPAAAKVKVWRGDAWAPAAPETLVTGERFSIAPGALVPVAARLEEETAEFALAWITGEAEPRCFRSGQTVPAGASLVGGAEARLTATQAWAGSMLSELLRPAERAPERARLIERVVKFYLVGIIGAAFAAGVWWGWRTGDAARTGAVVISILVVSCPCALGLAFPLAEEIATVRLRRRGVFLRAGDVWARLGRVRRVVFDKTGTLTGDTPELREPEALDGLSTVARSALLALVRENPHPVARALHEALWLRGEGKAMAGEVTEEVGRGVRLGSWSLERSDEHGVEAVLRRGTRVEARFAFFERARLGAREELVALRARGLALAVLSGDRREKVDTLAAGIGLKPGEVEGELGPREKAAWLTERGGGESALMLGDGANDSLAFDAALCRGTPAVHRGVLATKADFYYLGRGIAGVRALFEANDARRSTQIALLVFMIAYNLAAVGLAATGHMNPLFAAVLMPLSSLATLAIVWMGLRRFR
jgi:Cu2+-exporting ATPase